MLGDPTDFTEMIRGIEPLTKEASATKEFAWLFYPWKILVTLTFANWINNFLIAFK